jgi:8-oxo-dGTP pyrophosphatase MutT (NUDIX family)
MAESTARPSSTVVLVRDRPGGLETYLVRRHGRTAFGNAWAFPGGVVDADDARVHAACRGIDAGVANRLLEAPNGLNYYSAAIRELFEETGVLLAGTEVPGSALAEYRNGLNAGTRTWLETVDAAALTLDCDALHYLSYWITPRLQTARFATRFFVAAMPEEQAARHCGGELVDCTWLTPAEALDRHERGELPMIFPTLSTLKVLTACGSVAEVLAEADSRAAAGVVAILPRVIEADGERVIVLPDDPRYREAIN